jgi:hypothetical protein
MTDNARRTGAAVEAHYQFLAWLLQVIEKFPKTHKFTLRDRIVVFALDVLEALIGATSPRSACSICGVQIYFSGLPTIKLQIVLCQC